MAQDTGKDTPPHFKSQNKFQLQNRGRFVNGNGGCWVYMPLLWEITVDIIIFNILMQNDNNKELFIEIEIMNR